MKKRLFVDSEGTIRGVLDDVLEKMNLGGERTIERATTVQFNNDSQLWEAKLKDGTVLCEAPTYKEVLEKEAGLVEEKLKAREL